MRRAALAAAAALVFACTAAGAPQKTGTLIVGSRVFDGQRMLDANAVLVAGGKIVAVGSRTELRSRAKKVISFKNATVLPGFVDLHVHSESRRALKSGVTTVRNVGEAIDDLPRSPDKPGWQRIRSAGPIVSVPGGYPAVRFGPSLQIDVTSPADATHVVDMLVDRGADLIKISLEPGLNGTLPMLTRDEVKAIVAEAHARGRIVTAHVTGAPGTEAALAGGIDELAHMPCSAPATALMREVAHRGIPVVGTLHVEDDVGFCPANLENARAFVEAGGKLLYGTDYPNPGIPDQVDPKEIRLLAEAGLSPVQVLAAATGGAGHELGEQVGTLTAGAPADVLVVRGDPRKGLAALGRALLVLAGGKRVL